MRTKLLCLLLSVAIAGSGCATVIDGPLQTIDFRTIPSGATITHKGKVLGQTPCTVPVQRWDRSDPLYKEFVFEVSKKGYITRELELEVGINKTTMPNLLWFIFFVIPGFVAFGIDFLTGSGLQLYPGAVELTLQKGSGVSKERIVAPPQPNDYDTSAAKLGGVKKSANNASENAAAKSEESKENVKKTVTPESDPK
ncbi:MAG: hypothetical protein P1V97_05330 [Planctomycetota bacterium]|nr:hypothetical protein [Planctomycetota bacterium]